ncbi:MAG: putative metal-binding motif-containing protein, partial [Deltaproteobacteria bacterium]|nr:putative metal-binding motif-containing protein [Deltaproteobacteria bacterium]
MRLSFPLCLVLLALAACDDDSPDDTGTPSQDDTGTDDTGTDDTGSPPVDQDQDGYTSDVDCDDTNHEVHPGAPEQCDGLDNDCDGAIDEDFDLDADGQSTCAGDCDDEDATVYTGAPETPYDGIDQDCDGSDLEDVDGDGFRATEAGGNDCDDTNPDVNPRATEIPANGIDDDCRDGDDIDGDDDGYDSADWGGDDCDDGDPFVHPGAEEVCNGADDDCNDVVDDVLPLYLEDADGDGYGNDDVFTSSCEWPHGPPDGWTTEGDDCDDTDSDIHPKAWDWMNDGVDSDCDGEEPELEDLDDAPILLSGASGAYDLVGLGLDACDFDEDGLDDLLVGSPFGPSTSYHGQVGIFYGANSDTWTREMAMTDADVSFEGDSYDFVGFNAQCGDVDGDGHDDVVFTRGEINYSSYVTVYGVLIYYGDGTGFESSLSDADADAELTLEIGVVEGESVVHASEFRLGDIDNDDAEDILVEWPYTTLHGDGEILVIPGGVYSGSLAGEDYLADWWSPDQPVTGSYAYQQVLVLDDFDGDDFNDVFVGEPWWSETSGGSTYEGQVSLLSGVEGAAGSALADLAYAQIAGDTSSLTFGTWAASGDFDADGALDGVVSAIGDATEVSAGGGLWVWSDIAAVLAGAPSSPLDVATAHVWGSTSSGQLGYRLDAAGDVDGDGYGDLLVSEPWGGTDAEGRVWLLSGALLDGDAEVEDAALFGCAGM